MLEPRNVAQNAAYPPHSPSKEINACAVNGLNQLRRADWSVQGRQSFYTLDAMRAIAATAIVVLHSRLLFDAQWAPNAYLAVDLFFLLSGFILAHVYDGRGMTTRQFITLRAIRLYPLYALGLFFAIIQAAAVLGLGHSRATGIEDIISSALNAAFLPSPFPSTYGGYFSDLFPLNGASWSLFFEVLINIAFCTAVFKRSSVMKAIVIGSAFILITSALENGNLDTGGQWNRFLDGFARVGYSFTVGVLIRRARFSAPPWLKRIGPWPLLTILVGVWITPISANWRGAYDLTFVLLISPAVVWAGTQVQPQLYFRPLFSTLGGASYGIYAMHLPLMFATAFLGLKILHVPGWFLGTGFVICMMLFAVWLDRVYDKPIRRTLANWAGPKLGMSVSAQQKYIEAIIRRDRARIQ